MMKNKEFERWEQTEGIELLKHIGIKKGDTVVDFGCGNGYYVIAAAKLVGETGRVFGIDHAEERIAELKRRCENYGIHTVQAQLTDGELALDIPDAAADVVLLYDILHHFGETERVTLLGEINRALKFGGILSIHAPHFFEEGGALPELVSLLEQNGFEYTGDFATRLIHFRFFQDSTLYSFKKTD